MAQMALALGSANLLAEMLILWIRTAVRKPAAPERAQVMARNFTAPGETLNEGW
jgi:hypothetical protein